MHYCSLNTHLVFRLQEAFSMLDSIFDLLIGPCTFSFLHSGFTIFVVQFKLTLWLLC